MYHRFARSAENIAFVSESVTKDPNVSILRRPPKLRLSYGILWRIFHLDLNLRPYKIQLKQQLKPADHSERRRYVEWVLKQQAVDGNFFFSDEEYFTLGRYVSKGNCRV